ncbi:MAG: methyl-accepting chemotaxis protein [Solirubrobacterales bacterium]
MVGSFRQTISRIEHAAVELKQAAAEMAHTSDEAGHSIGEVAQAISAISQGASHQVDLVTQSSNVVAGIEGKIRDASEHARDAQRQSADTERLSDEGVARAAEVQDAMRAVRESSLNTAAVVRSLGDKSSDIDHIVQAITEIAHQTNMLALNASIEAARAGDQGRGFANVAEEVRVLAEDAQSSAEQIAALVREIKQQTEQAVNAMETGVMKVEDGFETVNRNRQTFYDISGAVHALHESSSEISELADGIAMGTGQVRQQIEAVATVAEESSASTEQVSASTQETSAAAEEVSASAQKVAETAANLAELSGRFKLPAASAAQRAA